MDLNRQFGTESVVLIGRGAVGDAYHNCSFATEGASRWLENAEIKNTTPEFAAQQMEGFLISGCYTRVQKKKSGVYYIPITCSNL
jgi:hypothetical protein